MPGAAGLLTFPGAAASWAKDPAVLCRQSLVFLRRTSSPATQSPETANGIPTLCPSPSTPALCSHSPSLKMIQSYSLCLYIRQAEGMIQGIQQRKRRDNKGIKMERLHLEGLLSSKLPNHVGNPYHSPPISVCAREGGRGVSWLSCSPSTSTPVLLRLLS